MKVFCGLGWDDIVRESKYEYINRVWMLKLGRFLNGSWPGELPEILMMEDDNVPGVEPRVGPAAGTTFVARKSETKVDGP